MCPRLRSKVDFDTEQLRALLEVFRCLLTAPSDWQPAPVELVAVAAVLHSFYCGIERLLEYIAEGVDGGAPDGKAWHRELVDRMTTRTDRRPAVLSVELADDLKEYLAFRHLFRKTYLQDLRWNKMRPLALRCSDVLATFSEEIERFLAALERDA